MALLQVESLVAAFPSSCPVFPGLPGRDGMPGPQGPPGTCACSDLSNTELVKGVKAISTSLDGHLQKLDNGLMKALGRIQQEVAQISCSRTALPSFSETVFLQTSQVLQGDPPMQPFNLLIPLLPSAVLSGRVA